MKPFLNCDMGESFGLWKFGDDEGLMPLIDAANLACGFHASDPITMTRTVDLAIRHGKQIGAHPSLPDREGFGRREMHLTPDELKAAFIYQIGALQGIVHSRGGKLSHVKPHGIITGMAARNLDLALAIAEAAAAFELSLLGLGGTAHEEAAGKLGVPFFPELYLDLPYSPQGDLIIPRHHEPTDVGVAIKNAERALDTGTIPAIDGTQLPIQFSTICVHSDSPTARELAKGLRELLQSRGG